MFLPLCILLHVICLVDGQIPKHHNSSTYPFVRLLNALLNYVLPIAGAVGVLVMIVLCFCHFHPYYRDRRIAARHGYVLQPMPKPTTQSCQTGAGIALQSYPTGGNVPQSYPAVGGNVPQSYPAGGNVTQSYPTGGGNAPQSYPAGGNVSQLYPAVGGNVPQSYPPGVSGPPPLYPTVPQLNTSG